jgi:hypothetical protein
LSAWRLLGPWLSSTSEACLTLNAREDGRARSSFLARRRRIGDDPHEIEVLASAILARLEAEGTRDPADDGFVHFRFANQLRNYWSWNGLYGFAFIVVTIGVLVTSLASSGIAAGWMMLTGRGRRSSLSV